MKIKDLSAFLQVCRNSGIRKAAESMYITPQGLSRQIQALEKHLGVPLFYRTAGGLHLTDYGRIFKRYAESVVDRTKKMESAIQKQWYETNQNVEFACSTGVLSAFFLPYLEELRRQNPVLHIQVWEGAESGVHDRVMGRESVIGIAPEPETHPRLDAVPLYSCGYTLLAARKNPLASCGEVTPLDLAGQDLIVLGEQSMLVKRLLPAFQRAGCEPRVTFSVSELLTAYKLAELDKGVLVLCDYLVDKSIGADLAALPLGEEFGRWTVSLLSRKGLLLSESVQLLHESLLRKMDKASAILTV